MGRGESGPVVHILLARVGKHDRFMYLLAPDCRALQSS